MKRFATGFLLALLACGLANIISYFVRTDAMDSADAIHRAGFPFVAWESGGVAYRHHLNQAALWANVAVALLLATATGLLFRRMVRT